MTAPRVRADYEQLKQAAQSFGEAGEAAAQTLRAIQKEKQTLEAGDWVGQGAKAFYQEMNESVLPTLQRLASAMQSARTTTLAISRVIKQAEDAAAALFRQPGGPAGATGFAGAAASASGSASVGGGGGFLSGVGDFFKGAFDEAKDMVGGLWHVATDPIGTIKGLAFAVTHPAQLWEAFKKPYVEAWESGHPWQAIGRGAFFAATLLVGAGEAGGAAKGAEAAGTASKIGEAARAAELAEAARAAEIADAIRAAKLADEAQIAARFGDTVEAAKALKAAVPGSQEASDIAGMIARDSTHIQPPAGRVVLGKWEETGGYIAEAKANGGIWYETKPGVYDAAGKEATWATNEAFLNQQMQTGVPRLEFHGLDVERELLKFDGVPFQDVPARVKEIRFLTENAGSFGYVRQGNTFVKVEAGAAGSTAAGTAARAGLAGKAAETAREANQ
ncbi:MAG: WXG100 family type VII secretion target [Anaerolineales bacterium]